MNTGRAFIRFGFCVVIGWALIAGAMAQPAAKSASDDAVKVAPQASETIVLQNPIGRNAIDLAGPWQVIFDFEDRCQGPEDNSAKCVAITGEGRPHGLVFTEALYSPDVTLNVPADWNRQRADLRNYDSTVFYRREIDLAKETGRRYWLHFGAANCRAQIYVNGTLLMAHEGGYTPFAADATALLKKGRNLIVAKVNAQRSEKSVPGTRADWADLGGLTREVLLIPTGPAPITNWKIRLEDLSTRLVKLSVKVDAGKAGQTITAAFPDLGEKATAKIDANGQAELSWTTAAALWSPDSPSLIRLTIAAGKEKVEDRVGLRVLSRDGSRLFLNGQPLYLRGINAHETTPKGYGRAYGAEDARAMLGLVKAMNANFVRFAHYPHNEWVVRAADEMGILLGAEVPVFQTIAFSEPAVVAAAENQLREMIMRDWNRASVILWSIGNENAQTPIRRDALKRLASTARALDGTRWITMAQTDIGNLTKNWMVAVAARGLAGGQLTPPERQSVKAWLETNGFGTSRDAIGELARKPVVLAPRDVNMDDIDIYGLNEYFGWYLAARSLTPVLGINEVTAQRILLDLIPQARIEVPNGKAMIISEFGADAKLGFAGDDETLFSEKFQTRFYRLHLAMIANNPEIAGTVPWVLMDFSSPRRMASGLQDGFNRKGLVDETGRPKEAYFLFRDHYARLAATAR